MNIYCHVSAQIAAHCDETEVLCPECGSTMTYIKDDLTCDKCGFIKEPMEPDYE